MLFTPEHMKRISNTRWERNQDFVIICNLDKKQFFFSTDHCQELVDKKGWVPISGSLPTTVVARPSLPDGIIRTLEQEIMIFHSDETEIPNPDPRYQPDYRPVPVR